MAKRDSEQPGPRWSPFTIGAGAVIVVGIGALLCLQFWYGEQIRALTLEFGVSLYEPKNAEAYLRYQSYDAARHRCLLGVIFLAIAGAVLAVIGQPRRRAFLPNDQIATSSEIGEISWIDVNKGVLADFRRIGTDGSQLYIDGRIGKIEGYPWTKVFVCDKDAAMLAGNRLILLRAANSLDTFDREKFDPLILRRVPRANFLTRAKFYSRVVGMNVRAWVIFGGLAAFFTVLVFSGEVRPGFGRVIIIWLVLVASTGLAVVAPYAMWRRYQGKPWDGLDGKPVLWQIEAMGLVLGLVGVISTVPGLFFNQPYWAINHVFRLISIFVGNSA